MADVRHRGLSQAVKKLRSLSEGDSGVVETVAFGKRAIPPLRDLLFTREPSGLFQTRCRAVDALAALGARNVLIEFLTDRHEATDPVERLGDDAVVNSVARALVRYSDEYVFRLLLALATRRPLPGVIAALGSFGRPDSIPCLIDALAEDECRPAAEAALEKLGGYAQDALIQAIKRPPPSTGEGPSQLRQRHSILRLLVKIATP